MRTTTILLTPLFVLACSLAIAKPPKKKKAARFERVCSVQAYVNDPDPAGLNVREGPGSKYKVVGVIPLQHAGTIVKIVGAKNGWLHINGSDVIKEDDSPVKPITDKGWVYGKLLRTDLRDYSERGLDLYSHPEMNGDKINKTRMEAMDLGIIDCSGGWVKVHITYQKNGETMKGWLPPEGQCPNPVTTCP